MNQFRQMFGRPSPAMIVACAGLAFALAGTALAEPPVAKLTKAKVRKIANKEIDKRAPGLSVAKAVHADTATKADSATSAETATKAGSATSAETAGFATNAGLLDNIDSAAFLRRDVCQGGAVLGFARFNPALMPAAPTFSSAGVEIVRNCDGGTVESSKVGVGDYRIRFNGIAAFFALCTTLENGDAPVRSYLALSLISSGNWRVTQTNSAGAAVDQRFVCMVI